MFKFQKLPYDIAMFAVLEHCHRRLSNVYTDISIFVCSNTPTSYLQLQIGEQNIIDNSGYINSNPRIVIYDMGFLT